MTRRKTFAQLTPKDVKAARAGASRQPPAEKPREHLKATMRDTLRAAGWLRVSEAAEKAGQTVMWVHNRMKRGDGPLTPAKGGSMRIEYLWFVFEPALRDVLGDAYCDLRGIRTRAQVAAASPEAHGTVITVKAAAAAARTAGAP